MWRLWACIGLLWCCSCEAQGQEELRVAFYNVENLFDTSDDPHTTDNEFLPRGEKGWTRGRYVAKLRAVARAVEGVGGGTLPAVVGLAEVENRRVLVDLVRKTGLSAGRYGIVHYDSPDVRGIDVALLYRKDCMAVAEERALRVPFPEDGRIRTRDVLYVKGVVAEDTVHFFVCHFPSMVGGERKSEWKRLRAAGVVRAKVDSLFEACPEAAVVVMGDLNGEADTEAQRLLCPANGAEEKECGDLYNAGYHLLGKPYVQCGLPPLGETLRELLLPGAVADARPHLSVGRDAERRGGSAGSDGDAGVCGAVPAGTRQPEHGETPETDLPGTALHRGDERPPAGVDWAADGGLSFLFFTDSLRHFSLSMPGWWRAGGGQIPSCSGSNLGSTQVQFRFNFGLDGRRKKGT